MKIQRESQCTVAVSIWILPATQSSASVANLAIEICSFVLITQHSDKNLHFQINVTTMGTNMAPQYANIFMVDLNHCFLSIHSYLIPKLY